MKFLYSHRTRSADGQRVHIAALVAELEARGHEVFMAGPDDFGPMRETVALDAQEGAGRLRSLLPKAVAEIAELGYSIRSYARLRRAARAAAPEILYERYNLFHHAGVQLAHARRLPLILEVNAPLVEERAAHGGLALPALAKASERAIWRAADAVLPVTAVLARRIEAAGVAPERLIVVPNGVDASFLADVDGGAARKRYGLDGKIVLGFTGFVRAWHGLDRILRYMAASERADLALLLVGDGATQPLLAQARAVGLAERFIVTGVVQREAVPAHVAAFDIALQPAVTEYASPLKLFEYMALARAIVAPASDNIREVLTDGEDALFVRQEDDAALARALDALIADAALRERLGAAARATLRKRDLTWSGNAARVERVARSLLEKQR